GVAGLLRYLGAGDELAGECGPGAQEVGGARVLAAGGGLPDGPAGAVDLVDEATAVERGHDGQVPDVVAREVLEHGGPLSAAGSAVGGAPAAPAAGRRRRRRGCGWCRCPRRSSRRRRRAAAGAGPGARGGPTARRGS